MYMQLSKYMVLLTFFKLEKSASDSYTKINSNTNFYPSLPVVFHFGVTVICIYKDHDYTIGGYSFHYNLLYTFISFVYKIEVREYFLYVFIYYDFFSL